MSRIASRLWPERVSPVYAACDGGSGNGWRHAVACKPGTATARLGWAMLACTSVMFACALALDLHTGSYKTLFYSASTAFWR